MIPRVPLLLPLTPEEIAAEKRAMWWGAGFGVAIAATIICVLAWLVHRDSVAEQRAIAAAPFQTGDTVQFKIAKIRGSVLHVSCANYCVYVVRFPAVSMETVRVREHEIEKVR